MTPHLAFFNTPGHGHVNPTLAVVAELVKRGYRVTYATTDAFVSAIEDVGATPVLYRSTLPAGPRRGPLTLDGLARQPLQFLDETIATLPQLEAFYEGDRPDLVLYDFMAWAGRVLAQKRDIPAVQLCPTFAANERFSLDRGFMAIDPHHPALAEFTEKLERFVSSQPIAGVSAEQFLGHIEKLQIVFLPRAFQYEGDTFDERFLFVGPCLRPRALQGGWRRPADDRPVLLISLGTAFNDWPEFFRMCVEAFADLPWHVVMSIGSRVDPASLGPLPTSFEVRPQVPQLAVLPHTRVFVSHAGMNSTMEALYNGVPLVVIPQIEEQEATAYRIAELGLGRLVPRAETRVEALREAVQQVSSDPDLWARVRDMQREVREAGGAKRAADGIESHLRGAPMPPGMAPITESRAAEDTGPGSPNGPLRTARAEGHRG